MKNTIKVYISLLLICSIQNKYLDVNLECEADDKIKNLTYDSVNVPPVYNFKMVYVFNFKGEVGKEIRLLLWNKSGSFSFSSIMTIGSKQFTTNRDTLWNSTDKRVGYLSDSTYFKNNKTLNIARYGYEYDSKFELNEYIPYNFTIPDEIYCTINDINSTSDVSPYVKPITYYYTKEVESILNLPELIHVPKEKTNTTTFTIRQPFNHRIKMTLGDSEILTSSKYQIFPLNITGHSYGGLTIEYNVESDKDKVDSCKVDIVICHKFCNKCKPETSTTDTNQNCLGCIRGYKFESNSSRNCKKICSDKWYVTPTEVKCDTTCPEDYPLLIYESRECVKKCLLPKEYYYQGECLVTCPPETNDYNNKCYDTCFPLPLTNDDSYIYMPYFAHECISVIDEIILYYNSLKRNIKGKDFLLQVYSTDHPLSSIKPISSIDIAQCIEQLKIDNTIPITDELIIAKFDFKNDVDQVEYNIYDLNGKKLKLSLCYQMRSIIQYPITNHDISLERLKDLDILNINSYDGTNNFFNEQCYPFYYHALKRNKTVDVVLLDRRKYFLSQIPICESNCNYINVIYSERKANCSCLIKQSLSTSLVTNPPISYTLPNISNLNFEIVKCYHLLLSFDNLITNFGFWFQSTLSVLQIVCIIGYLVRRLSFLYPKLYRSSEIIGKKIKTKNITNSIQPQSSDSSVQPNATTPLNNLNKSTMNTELNNNHVLFRNVYDKIVTHRIPLIRVFKPNCKYEIQFLYISFNVLNLSLISAFNALITQDKVISIFFTSLSNPHYTIAVNSFYCSIAYSIISRILRYLIFYHHRLEKEEEAAFYDKRKIFERFRLILKRSSIMILCYIHIALVLTVCCCYYVTLFCIIYPKTQIILIYSTLISIIFSSVLFLLMSVMFAVMEYFSLKYRSISWHSFAMILITNLL